ncbi:hypothetical protein DAPPUDRAFT_262014 [Daphnia pulex]|uniref:Tubulin-specific chaperone D n=1 Tax=Daphnia pulex TaxID=6669 RepID=E9HM51_DAPPU|nr:hypothetical protein DAPPUDRAFT_262014 [Daphnia pulex]|eukprot:EFX67201.1 hypothetical protein DAPPUDRAFT_262014 [Daphnia pulex]
MTLEVADECSQCTEKEIDVIGLGCSKESFTEHSEVEKLIDELRTSAQHQTNQTDIRLVERNWQRFSFILDQYQEQPHLIDSHLDGLLTKIINIIREGGLDYEVKHVAFRCLYFILKVRGFKVVARHLPHETADLEPLLHYLENQDPGVQLKWETHYGLLLWLSIAVKIPFHLQRFDTSTSEPIMERPDVKDSYLPGFINWAHERGSRSLAANLQQSQPVETKAAISVNDEDDHDYDVPEEIKEVLDEILQALRDKNREVQYSAAKGIGRLTSRLSKNFADQAMLYDELRGNFSVGSAVRDAACYLCWALARSYDPSLLQPFVHQLAKALVITTVFDREEHVGRQGTFPHGIDILTTCDYFAVGLRKNAYLQLSLFVAQYEEYRPHLIQHLVDRKVIHWDTVIRQLTSQALHQMTFLDPESMKLILSTQILPRCTNPELYLRHGSILASGKVISALCQVAKDHQRRLPDELGDAAMESITQTCIDILEERFWRSWLKALRECLASADSNVQQSAISAVTALIGEYFRHQPVEKLTALLNHFLPEVTSNNQQARVGNALALGSMPRFLLTVSLPKVIQQLCTCTLITDKTLQWAESRKNALTALSLVCTTVGIAPSSPVLTNTSQPELLEADLIRSLEELRSIIPPPPLDISTEKECFDLWMKVIRLDTYRKAVITGLVSSIGSLTESWRSRCLTVAEC